MDTRVDSDSTDLRCDVTAGGSPVAGANVLRHVELVYRSGISGASSVLIIMVRDSSRCYQSAIVVSGSDLFQAGAATYNHVLFPRIGQSENGAR